MKGYRSIHIDGEEWNWRAGKQFLTVKSPNGERHNFPRWASKMTNHP